MTDPDERPDPVWRDDVPLDWEPPVKPTPPQEVTGDTPQPVPVPVSRGRINIQSTVLYQSPASRATVGTGCSFGVWVVSEEDPYKRRYKVGEAWVQLDLGYFAHEGRIHEIGYITIKNAPSIHLVNPTPERVKEDEGKVLILGLSPGWQQGPARELILPFDVVHPLDQRRLYPTNPDRLYLRCQQGTCEVQIVIYPR